MINDEQDLTPSATPFEMPSGGSEPPLRIGSTIDSVARNRLMDMRPTRMVAGDPAAGAARIALEEQSEQIRNQMMASVATSMQHSPDQLAQAHDLGDQVGVSARLAVGRMNELRKSVQLRDLENRDLPNTAPKLAQMLGDPDVAGVSHDDIDNLSMIERGFNYVGKTWENWVNSVASGIVQTQQAIEFRRWRETNQGAQADPLMIQRMRAYEQALASPDLAYEPGFVSAVGTLVGQQVENVPQSVKTGLVTGGYGAAAGAVGGPAGFATIPAGFVTGFGMGFTGQMLYSTFEQESGNAYAEMMRLTNNDHAVASQIADGVGALNAAVEAAVLPLTMGAARGAARKLILGEVSKQINAELLAKPTLRRAVATIGKNAFKQTSGETAQEVLQEIVSIVGEHAAMRLHDPNAIADMDTAEGRARIGTRIKDIAVQTAMGMSVLGIGAPATELYAHMRSVRDMNRQQRFLNDLTDATKRSKVAARSKTVFERIVARSAEGTDAQTVYVNASALRAALAKAELPVEALDKIIPGIAQQLEAATGVDDDVTISTAAYAARLVGTPFEQVLREHMRLSADAPSISEARADAKAMTQRMLDAETRLDESLSSKSEQFREEVKSIHDELLQQVKQAGRSDIEARMHAVAMSEMIANMAEREGVSPAEMWARHRNTIEGDGAAIEQQPLMSSPEEQRRAAMRQLDAEYVAAVERGDNAVAEQQFVVAATSLGIAPEQIAKMPVVRRNAAGQVIPLQDRFPTVFRQSLSTRLPSAAAATEDPLNNLLSVDYAVAVNDPDTLAKNMAAMRKMPNWRPLAGKGSRDPVVQAEAMIKHIVDNLLFLHDAMDPEWRERARLWYDGGRKTVDAWSLKYGISPMQAAALIAVLSPQNGWFENVSQAERILDIVFAQSDHVWDEAMTLEAARILGVDENGVAVIDEKMEQAKGKTLAEVLQTPDVAARWIRVYDQTHNNRAFRVLTPEGGVAGFVQTGGGADAIMRWKSYTPIAKAVSILRDGRAQNVYVQLGNEHKVRNFYNNLFAPNSNIDFVTIDTHAVAAGLLRSLSATSEEVNQAFGSSGSASSSITGLNGTYPIFLEAYRRAAQARGLKPREMQSITWEAVRGLFEAAKKSGLKDPADAIWKRYQNGDITQQQAQQEIMSLANGITAPSWTKVDFNDVIGRTYSGDAATAFDAMQVQRVAAQALPRNTVFVEIAPHPENKILTAQWNALSGAQQVRITEQMIAELMPKVLEELNASGAPQFVIGGFEDATNPSVILSLDNNRLLVTAAKMLGYLLDQKAMLAVAAEKMPGMEARGAINISLPDGYGAQEIAALYSRLRELKDDQGKHLVGGHTTANGHMVILNYSGLDTAALAAMIDAHLDGAFMVHSTDVFAADLTAKDYDYDTATTQQPLAGRQSSTERIRNLREATAREFQRAVADEYRRGIDGRPNRYPDGTPAPLVGAPVVEGATGPDPSLVAVAEQYARDNGIPFARQAYYASAIKSLGKRIADAYDKMKHQPRNPRVKAAYAELIKQTTAQYRALEAAGYKFWFYDGETDPYDTKPFRAMVDLRANKSMAVFATDAGFGSDKEFDVSDNPLLADTGIMWPYGAPDGPLKRVLANDLFRAVHDAFGHGLEGAGFRADGEENAWQAHVRLFTGDAIGAMTSETRGQNSWLNFGPHGERNRTAGTLDTEYAIQKTGLMPEWTWQEGVVPNEPTDEVFQQSPQQAVLFSALRRELAGIDTKPLTADSWNQRLKALISAGKIKEQELLWSGLQEWLAMQPGKVSKEQVQGFLDGNGVRVEVITRTDNAVALTAALEKELAADDADVIQRMRDDLAALEYEPVVLNALLVYRDTGTGDIMNDAMVFTALQQRFGVNHENYRKFSAANWTLDAAFAKVIGDMAPLHRGYMEEGGSNFRNILVTAPGESFIPKHVATRLEAQQADIDARVDTAEEEYKKQAQPLHDNLENLTKELSANKQARLQLLQANSPEPIESYSGSMAPNLATHGEEKLRVILEAMLKFDEASIDKYVALQKDMDRIMRARSDADVAIRAFRDKFYNEHLAELYEDRQQVGRQLTPPNFVNSAHFEESNILVHALVDDRIGADGKRVLSAREIQSDWGQDARDGFAPTPQELAEHRRNVREMDTQYPRVIEIMTDYLSRGGIADAKIAAVNLWWDVVAKINDGKTVKPLTDATDEDNAFIVRIATLQVQNEQNDPNAKSGVPRAPFVHSTDAWVTLMLKQLLVEAVNNNYDRIVISNGEDVASHYGGMNARQREGTRVFYDEVIPAAANKLLKRLGAAPVTKSDVRGWHRDTGERWLVDQTTIEITPELREKILGEGLPLYQARRQPGARGTFDPRTLATRLTSAADASTLIHESGHFYLTMLGRIAAQPDASERTVQDIDEVLRWFGIDGNTAAERLAKWNAMPLREQEPFHEQWAYNWEIYHAEGRAPSVALEGVFERFSKWLKQVYRNIRDDLNEIYRAKFGKDLPLLTPEVRGVMDRLLATDEQIEHAEAVRNMKPMFQTQDEAGMNDAEWAAYQQMNADAHQAAVTDLNKASMRQMQWLSNATTRVLKALQAKHDALRKEVREEVSKELRREPVYRAMLFMKSGILVNDDGTEDKVDAIKLNRAAVEQMYSLTPPELRPDLRRLARFSVETGGLHPDILAERFGFSSGDALINAILTAKPFGEAVTERTDARMLAEHGDMNTPEARKAAVEQALHSEARARFVAVELRFLAKAMEPVRVMLDAAKQAAKQTIDKKVIRELRPSEYANAEAKAARLATEAAQTLGINADPERAAKSAYKRAYDEQASAVASGLSESNRVAKATQKAEEARKRAQARLDAYNAKYKGRPAAEVAIDAKRKQLFNNQLAAEAMRAREEVDSGIKYLRRVLDNKNRQRMGAAISDQIAAMLERFDLHRMSAEEAARRTKLADWLAEQADLGIEPDLSPEMQDAAYRKPYQQMTVAEFRDLLDAVKQLEYMGKNAEKVRLAGEQRAFEQVRDELVTDIKANRTGKPVLTHRTATTWAGRVSKGVRTYFATHMKAATIFKMFDGGKDAGRAWQYFMRTANEAGDRESTMIAEATTRLAEILKPVKALGNMESGAINFPSIGRALTRGERFVLALNMGNAGNIDRMLVGEGWSIEQLQPVLASLTATEWKAVQQIWDLFETFKPLVAEKERRLFGKEPNWIDPQPFTITTADGKTMTLNGGYYPIKYDPAASEREAREQNAEEVKAMMRGAYTAATTRRSYTKDRAAKGKGTPILFTMSGVYSGLNEVIHDLAWHEWLLHANKMLRDPTFSRAIGESFKDAVEIREALRTWVQAIAAGQGEAQKAADKFAVFARRSISASRLGFNAFSGAMQVTGFANSVTRIGPKWLAIGMQTFAAHPIRTAEMVRDMSQFMRNRARTQFRDLNEIKNMVQDQSGVNRALQSNVFAIITTMQTMVDIPTWVGAYQSAMEAGNDQDTAVAMADQAVIDSQGSGMLKDLAAVERGGPWMKLFTVFYGFQNTLYNQMAASLRTKSGTRATVDLIALIVVPAIMKYYLTQLLKPKRGDDEEDDEALIAFAAKESFQTIVGSMVGLRELGDLASDRSMGYQGPSGVSLIVDLYKAKDQTMQAELDKAFFKAWINVAGDMTGIPSAQINRTIDGLEHMIDKGTIEPRGMIFGTRR